MTGRGRNDEEEAKGRHPRLDRGSSKSKTTKTPKKIPQLLLRYILWRAIESDFRTILVSSQTK